MRKVISFFFAFVLLLLTGCSNVSGTESKITPIPKITSTSDASNKTVSPEPTPSIFSITPVIPSVSIPSSTTPSPTDNKSENTNTQALSSDANMVFQDKTIEKITRLLLDIPTGNITLADVLKITDFSQEDSKGNYVAASAPISTLNDLFYFKNLKKLDLSWCHIKSLKGIENLTQLEDINVLQNDISDISLLSNLKNLKTINLGQNEIADLSPLSKLKNLKVLSIGPNIADLSPISNLSELEELGVGGKSLNLNPLKNLSKLKKLYVPFSGISDISPLTNLTNLTDLSLYHNNISDISPLHSLVHLTSLDIDLNPIKDISVLDVLPNLVSITINKTNLSEKQLWDHFYSRHWHYSSTSVPFIYVDVSIVSVSEFSRTYKIQISNSKDMSQSFESFNFDSYCNIEGWNWCFVDFSDVNNDGFLDLQISTGDSAKLGMMYIAFVYDKESHKFVEDNDYSTANLNGLGDKASSPS